MTEDPERRRAWREDVSFFAGDERYISRRQLGKFLVLTSLGMFVGNAWILFKSRLHHAVARFAPKWIAPRSALAVGQIELFDYPTSNDHCLLVRARDGRLHAFSQKCTHLSCAVIYSAERDRLECPCHDGVFSVETGAVEAGPPPRPLPRILLDVRRDGVYAVGVYEPGGARGISGEDEEEASG